MYWYTLTIALQDQSPRSQYPPGYSGHQAGRHSVVGSSNPAAIRHSQRAPRDSSRGKEVTLSSDLHTEECETVFAPSTSVVEVTPENAKTAHFASAQFGSVNLTLPNPSMPQSYCNPAYVRSARIVHEEQNCSRDLKLKNHRKSPYCFHEPGLLAFDGTGTGFAVGHSTKTSIWKNEDTLKPRTEYRSCFVPATDRRPTQTCSL